MNEIYDIISIPTLSHQRHDLEMVQHKMLHKNQHNIDSKPDNNQALQNNQCHRDAFFQLAGHKECFKKGSSPNTILKRSTGNEEECFNELMKDNLSPFVPKIIGTVKHEGQTYLEMQDLLANFDGASVMDVKMGCRTYREAELDNAFKEAKLRRDMYDKMIEVDADEPTPEEKEVRAITKPRYMIWRETVSSTASLGFRIEGMRLRDGTVDKNFKIIKNEEQIANAFIRYTGSNKIRLKYLNRLYDLRQALLKSKFFLTHELIGSSLLFVHSDSEANIWLIDFAKTHLLPEDSEVTHRNKWELGNHEDGYLIGIDNLIRIFESLFSRTSDSNIQVLQVNQHMISEEMTKHHSSPINHAILNGSNVTIGGTKRYLPELKT